MIRVCSSPDTTDLYSLTQTMRARLTQIARLVSATMFDEPSSRNLRVLMKGTAASFDQQSKIIDAIVAALNWCISPLKKHESGQVNKRNERGAGDRSGG